MTTTHHQKPEPTDGGLYAKKEKIYTRKTEGLFANLTITSGIILLGIFYLFPWLTWDSRQAVLFDLGKRQFYIFGFIFWPQDFIFLAFLLIIAGLSLFFFTTLAGRLWCGFACPQTIWTDAFIWMERMVEGDRPQRMKLDKQPWTAQKLKIKATKHAVWIIFAIYTGFTFVGYFTPIRELWHELITFTATGWEVFWIFFYGLATYGNAGFLREQICTYMCPYARFQSAMFDKDTMIIAYDTKRGEPRGSRKKGIDFKAQGLGECVDCTMCVQVCPTGIDIRDGLQYTCISCSACIDACNNVMDKVGYPRGLIRYTTEHALEGKTVHILRPRVFVYGGILLLLFAILIGAILSRNLVQLDVIRDRGSLYRENTEGLIENAYLLKIMNKDTKDHSFKITVSGIDGLKIMGDDVINVEGGSLKDLPLSVAIDPSKLQTQNYSIDFKITSVDDTKLSNTEEARFMGPRK